MKRTILFIVINLAICLLLSIVYGIVCSALGIDPYYLSEAGIDYPSLMVYSLVFGMSGAVISLLLSKPIAKWTTGAKAITGTEGANEAWLVQTVQSLADRAGIRCPEVAIYHGDPNAFATGAFKNSALVAVSDGIMNSMTKAELRAVLGHEISHITNGDMVTMTLLQGTLNAVVIFLSRVIAYFVDAALSGKKRRGPSFIYRIVVIFLQYLLGFFASLIVCAYSRKREFAADAGSAQLMGTPTDMIAALRRLGGVQPGVLPDSLKAMGISGKSVRSMLATHPSIPDRIRALQGVRR